MPPPSTPLLTPAQLNYAESSQWKQIAQLVANDIRHATPAFLAENLDPNTQTVMVQIAIQERVGVPVGQLSPTGQPMASGQQWWDIPPIIYVPILLPRGGGFSLTLPLKKGDQGMLIFCDTCFDNWWRNGQANAPPAANVTTASGSQTQFEVRRHHVHDCGFFPGMWSQNNTLIDYSTDSMQLRSEDATQVIDLGQSGTSLDTPELSTTTTSGEFDVDGPLVVAGNLSVSSGATGTFSTSTGQVVTVQNGIVISIQ